MKISCIASSTHQYRDIHIKCSTCPFLYLIYIFQHEITFERIFCRVSSMLYAFSMYLLLWPPKIAFDFLCLSPVEVKRQQPDSFHI